MSDRGRASIFAGLVAAVTFSTAATSPVHALDIDGVQPAALDQPRVNLYLTRPNAPAPLTANVDGVTTCNVEAFLDTGASGVVLSFRTANLLNIQAEKTRTSNLATQEARFQDVGLGGSVPFAISEPLGLALAPSDAPLQADGGPPALNLYTQQAGPLRVQIGPLTTSNDLLASLAVEDLDVAGMPTMLNRVVVMDMAAVNAARGKIDTTVYGATSPDLRRMQRSKFHVRLREQSLEQYTKTTPAAAVPPTLAPNPFIGPGRDVDGSAVPPVTITHHGKTITGTWLLDTGAATSMISRQAAAQLGVTYATGTYGSEHPRLLGVPVDGQFTLSVAGIGGGKQASGFYLDQLALSTVEQEPIRYQHAPVLVADVTIKSAANGQQTTLDGVFGMNFLTASAKLDTSRLLNDLGNLTKGAYRRVVFDEHAGLLALQP